MPNLFKQRPAEPARRSQRGVTLIIVGALSAAVAFLGVVQVRSQAEVVRSLEGQDNTSLAFLIDDLHRANDSLGAQAGELTARRDQLRLTGATDADPVLQDEGQRLRALEGLVPVHGPGLVMTVDAPLTRLDLEDAVNNLRASGAEQMSINDHRVITGTVFRQNGSTVAIDGDAAHGPWTIAVIGNQDRLAIGADLMLQSLRSDRRVRQVSYRMETDLVIRAIVSERPFVYGTP
jgi:uncharacterized protein YlxW (UPF0749 family)